MKCRKETIKYPLILAATLLLSILPAGEARALMVELSLEELSSEADAIIIGRVESTASHWNTEQTSIYTTVTVVIENKLKGLPTQDKVTIVVPGGEIDGITQLVSDTPAFEPGEEAIIFIEQLPLQKHQRNKYQLKQYGVFGNFQGKLEIRGNQVEDIPLDEIEELILKIVEEGSTASTLETNDSEMTLVSNYAYVPLGIRWSGSSPVVEFRVNASTDYNNHVQAAAATWSNAGANFRFQYGGTHSRNGTAALNQVNEIMWANLGTTSALALATIWFSGGTIIEADLVMNTLYPWTTNPYSYHDVQTVALHELGHWLGLDHSPVYESIMFYQYKGTQRNLSPDDISGIRYIYGTAADITYPVNDNFSNRLTLSGLSGQTSGNNHNATREAGEPLHAGVPGGASVWWEWTAPETGFITIDTFGSNFDTILAVYRGSVLSELTHVAANDDYGETRLSRVEFDANNGTIYKIAVDGWRGNSGSIVLNWQLNPVPDEESSDNSENEDGSGKEDAGGDQEQPPDQQEAGDSDPVIIAVPQRPAGPVTGFTHSGYSYFTNHITCEDGTATLYQFDWGNNTFSEWSDSVQALQSWPVAGIYQVRVRVCSVNNQDLISAWSEALTVQISEYHVPETVSPPPPSAPAPDPVTTPPASAPAPEQFTLTITVRGEGTTNPIPGSSSYNKDAEIELTAKPALGWRFERWVINSREIKTISTRIKVTENINATAFYSEVSKGDITGDGSVNVNDISLAARYVLGLTTLTEQQINSADVNGDGIVDVRDTVLLMRLVLGLITYLPNSN